MMVEMEQNYVTAGFFRHFMFQRHEALKEAAAPLKASGKAAAAAAAGAAAGGGLKARLGMRKAKLDSLMADDPVPATPPVAKLSRQGTGSTGERCSGRVLGLVHCAAQLARV